MSRQRWMTAATAVTAAAFLALAPAATAAPALGPGIDTAAPTPTTPAPGGPEQGHSPDGSTVGGDGLDTRGVAVDADAPALPSTVTARGWVLADLDAGRVLAARDPHGRYYPASTLKTLTLVALHGRVDPTAVVVGTEDDAAVEGTRVGLVPGGRYPVPLLWRALIMASGNDAANALARAAGGTDAALAAMNEAAGRLQAYDTLAGTPSGLDVSGQSSSPYDLALFMREIVSDPDLLALAATPTLMMPAVPPRFPAYQIQNQDPLLDRYPGILAGKTGFTDAARHTFVGAAERDGHRLVVSLMQGEQTPVSMADQAAALLDWGFALPAGTASVGDLVSPLPPGVDPPTAPRTPATSAPGRSAIPAAAADPRAAAPARSAAATTDGPAPLLVAAGAAGSAVVLLLALTRLPTRGRHR